MFLAYKCRRHNYIVQCFLLQSAVPRAGTAFLFVRYLLIQKQISALTAMDAANSGYYASGRKWNDSESFKTVVPLSGDTDVFAGFPEWHGRTGTPYRSR